MTKIKQFIYVCLSAIILSAAHPQVVAAATRLAPVHLYTWARQGNLNRLHQFKRYINLQDANHNTALCIAQQNKDRSAYALLLKFGASTKVACHDDNDPVCAVIAGEKLKVSPAAWWLLGLGAAAGAYKLLDNDGGHKHKRCPTGYSTKYQSVADCGTSGSNGWTYTYLGKYKDLNCGKCTPFQCSQYDDGKGVSNVTECPTYSTLQVAVDTNAIGWAGDKPCYKCTYTCKADLYTSQSSCEEDNDGYSCKSTTENGITCWAPDEPIRCPTGYDTKYQSVEDCGPHGSNGWTYTSSGTSRGLACGKCDPYQCSRYDDGKGVSDVTECPTYSTLQVATDTNAIGWAGETPCYKCTYTCKADYYTSKTLCEEDNDGYTCKSTTENGVTCWAPDEPTSCPTGYSTDYQSVSDCGTSGSNGWSYTSSGVSGNKVCGKCTPYQCSRYDDGKGVSNVTECQTYSTLQVATDTNAIGWAGDTPCYKCTYSCKADYYTSKPLCESDNPGYTCTDTTENGITCWAPNDPAACPIGYSTSIQGLNDCSTTHPEGYTYTSSGTSGGVSCGKCTPKSCRTNYTYSSVTACGTSGSNGWTWTQDTTTPYAGETACGSCTPYQCSHYDNGKGVSNVTECQNYSTLQAATDTNAIGWAGDTPCYKCTYSCKADYYTSKPLCESDNPGYTCTDTTENGITCWAPGTASSCPTGYSTSYQSVADCGTLNLGSNSWNYTSSGTSGGKLCGMCTPKACPTGYDTQYSDLSKCNRNYNYIEPVDTNQNGHSGDTPCYKCTYVCKSDYRYSSAAACADDWDEPCTPKTENGVTCYVPSSISGASSRRDITIINTNTVNLTSESNEDIYGYTGSMDIENGIDEETGKAGTINITHNSTGNAYGIYGKDGNNIINREGASINIANNNGGNTYGIYSEQGGSVTNEGIIRITGLSGTATGIYGEGGNTIINTESGIIDVSGETAYGIYVKDGTDTRIENAGTIYAQGDNAHGIYVDENSHNATVINTGSIYLNGTDSGDAGITLNGGSIRNTGLMSFSGNADFNAINARFYLEDGGVYEAESLSGDLTVGVSNILGSNQDTYINENALQAENVEDLNLVSESAMFTASIRSMSSASPASVVLTRRNFEEITPNASVANYMEQNYQDGNLTDMYDDIKAKNTLSAAARESAKQLGYDVLPNFAEENYIALKSLNRNISDNILTPTDETHRVVAGADYINTETDNKGLLSGYELDATSMYTYGDTRLNNNNRLGLGLSITQLRSDYDKGGDRELNIFNLFVPYMHKFTDNLRWASILSVGYGNGEYDRGNNHESDISDIFYGWANELRYTMDLNGFAELEPALMLNTLGYTEEGFDEGHQNSALKSKKTNNLSVEAGFGLFLKKNVSLNNYGKLGFKIGGVHYRELADQYDDIKLRHKGANGWYKVNDYAHIYDNNRTVLEAAIDYEFKRFSMYAKFNQLLQRNDPKLFDLGLKYNF